MRPKILKRDGARNRADPAPAAQSGGRSKSFAGCFRRLRGGQMKRKEPPDNRRTFVHRCRASAERGQGRPRGRPSKEGLPRKMLPLVPSRWYTAAVRRNESRVPDSDNLLRFGNAPCLKTRSEGASSIWVKRSVGSIQARKFATIMSLCVSERCPRIQKRYFVLNVTPRRRGSCIFDHL
jgi:hypothetical protein